MKKFGVLTGIAGFLLLIAVIWVNVNNPSPQAFTLDEESQKEADAVLQRMQETEFLQQTSDALKEKGYHPTGISVQIYSFTQKELLIMMSNINGNVEGINEEVRLIVNQVAETNQLGSFSVKILGNN